MKKIFLLSSVLLLMCFQASDIAFAQTAGTSTIPTQTPTPEVNLDYQYNAVLEFFLGKTLEKDYAGAFTMMANTFKKYNSFDSLKKTVGVSGLTDFTSKKWTKFDNQMESIGVTTVYGDFDTPDGITHHVSFQLIVQGETELKIGAIVEKILIDELPKRFPAKANLEAMIMKDLTAITKMVKKNQSRAAYKYLSSTAKQRIKLKDVVKAFKQFKIKKLDPTLLKSSVVTLDYNVSPQLSKDGIMLVQGTFTNKKYLVTYVLGYDYEWEWSLGFFNLNTQLLTAAQGLNKVVEPTALPK